jgi:cell division inhibitor SulA/protein ImuA
MSYQALQTDMPRQALVKALAQQVRQYETARRRSRGAIVSTGYAALDASLPERGVHRGTLAEWLAGEAGSGATTLALAAAREACGEMGTLVVVDRRRMFYPLAAAGCGIDLSRMLVVRPQNDRDETWAIDQALRSGGASAVLAWPEKLDDHLFRRLQLAAEAGDALALFVRPAYAAAEPSWAETRWLIEPAPSLPSRAGPAPRRVQVAILRAPGRAVAHTRRVILDLNDPMGNLIEPQISRRVMTEKRIA